jgi:hypothetical protein
MPIKLKHFILGIALLLLSLRAMSSSYQVHQVAKTLAQAQEIFVRASVSKPSVYVGEAFTVTYTLYTSVAIIDPENETNIQFGQSYQERYPLNVSEKEENIAGKLYRVRVLQQYLVIANVSGKLQIPPLKKAIQRSIIDANDFFGQEKLVTQMVVSPSESIIVKPLPLSEESNLFSRAVGNFKMKGEYRPVGKTPNLLEFNLTIEGIGNTKNCSFTLPKSNDFWEIYNVTTTNKDTLELTGLKTKLEYSFQIATNYKGTYRIPDFAVTVFNPNTNSYQKFSTGSYQWIVTQGISAPSKTISNSNTIASQENYKRNSGNLYSYSTLFYLLVGLGILLLLCVSFESYILKQWNIFQHYRSQQRALKVALFACQQQFKRLDSLSRDVFFQNVTEILLQYIQQKKGNDFVSALVHSNFKKASIYSAIETQDKLELWWQHTQYNRFGITEPNFEPKEHLRQLEALLRILDRHE